MGAVAVARRGDERRRRERGDRAAGVRPGRPVGPRGDPRNLRGGGAGHPGQAGDDPDPEKSPSLLTRTPPPRRLCREARRTLLVRGAPGASANAAELFLYRAFAPHGAVVSVRSTSGSNAAEHVVQFRRAAEADAARARALDGGALGALRVTALDAP